MLQNIMLQTVMLPTVMLHIILLQTLMLQKIILQTAMLQTVMLQNVLLRNADMSRPPPRHPLWRKCGMPPPHLYQRCMVTRLSIHLVNQHVCGNKTDHTLAKSPGVGQQG